MGDPRYVYQPRSPELRSQLSAAHKRRLGIPDGMVQIYGVHVPQGMDYPLRQYASWVNQKRGLEAAVAFVEKALARGRIEKPSPHKVSVTSRAYIYRPWPNTVLRRIKQLSKRPGPPSGEAAVIYGIAIPKGYERVIRPHAKKAAEKAGREAARWIICEAWAEGWPELGEVRRVTDIDWDLVDALFAEHATNEDISRLLGMTEKSFRDRLRTMS